MASQAGLFNVQEFADAGAPLVGGRLYTYAYGTTTQKVAYTDQAGTIPHTYTLDASDVPYIALNARGELPAPLYLTSGSYDLALKRSDGSTVWTRRADGSSLDTSSGASLVGYGDTTVADMLAAVNLPGYSALRAYTGSAKSIYLTGYLATVSPAGVSGRFVRDDSDVSSGDNSGTVIVDALGRRWKRIFGGRINAQWFGATPGGAASANSTALQAAIDVGLIYGRGVHIPGASLSYEHDVPLSIVYDPTNIDCFNLTGDSSIAYYQTSRGTFLSYTGGSGYCLTINGRGIGVDGLNEGSPMAASVRGISFIGSASLDGAIKIDRGWFVEVEGNNFFNFTKTTSGVVTIKASSAASATAFAGDVTVYGNRFVSSGKCVWLTGNTGGVVNAVHVMSNIMIDQQYGLANDFGADVPYAEHMVFQFNRLEGTVVSDVYSQGAAANWTICYNYFEQNLPTYNSPRVDIQGSANFGIVVEGNTFSKQLQAAGQALVRIANGKGVSVVKNVSNYGGSTDRWSVELQTCTGEADPMDSPAAPTTPYPVLMNNVIIFSGRVNDKWRQVAAGGAGNFVGISSGDGYPGGTVCTVDNEYSKTNGRVDFNFKAVVTTKSASGTSLLIGVLPLANYGNDVVFPVFTKNVTGTQPFYGILPSGLTVATVYDATGTAVNYQTAVSVGSEFRANLSYLTQA